MLLFPPNIAYATLDEFLAKVNNQIINPLIAFLFALAIAFFLYGVFSFIMNQNNEEKRSAGKRHMIWGVIGITIMLSVWTIMNVILNTFDIDGIEIQRTGNDGEIRVDLNVGN